MDISVAFLLSPLIFEDFFFLVSFRAFADPSFDRYHLNQACQLDESGWPTPGGSDLARLNQRDLLGMLAAILYTRFFLRHRAPAGYQCWHHFISLTPRTVAVHNVHSCLEVSPFIRMHPQYIHFDNDSHCSTISACRSNVG